MCCLGVVVLLGGNVSETVLYAGVGKTCKSQNVITVGLLSVLMQGNNYLVQ